MRKRFTEEQIVKALQMQTQGKTVAAICREIGIAEQTFYIWKHKYGNMKVCKERFVGTPTALKAG